MNRFDLRVVLGKILVILDVANGAINFHLRYYDRRVLMDKPLPTRARSAGVPDVSGATVFDISKSAGAIGNGQADMTVVRYHI